MSDFLKKIRHLFQQLINYNCTSYLLLGDWYCSITSRNPSLLPFSFHCIKYKQISFYFLFISWVTIHPISTIWTDGFAFDSMLVIFIRLKLTFAGCIILVEAKVLGKAQVAHFVATGCGGSLSLFLEGIRSVIRTREAVLARTDNSGFANCGGSEGCSERTEGLE